MRRAPTQPVKPPNPSGAPRIQRFQGTTLYRVKKLAPWAAKIAKVDGVYIAYESILDYSERHGVSDLSVIRKSPAISEPKPWIDGPKYAKRAKRRPTLSPAMIEGIATFVERHGG